MPFRGVEDIIDFGDDELNLARSVAEQARNTRGEDESMTDKSFLEYREEKDDGSESENPNVSSQSDVFYPKDGSGDQVTSPRYPPSSTSGRSDVFYLENEEKSDYETNSPDTSTRYPPSDANSSDENILTSSKRSNSEEVADVNSEMDEISLPPSPMSTDVEGESDEIRQVPSPIHTGAETDDTEMFETITVHPAKSVNHETSKTVAHPAMSGRYGMSKTAPEPARSAKLKSQIFSLAGFPSSQTLGAKRAPAMPNAIGDSCADTSNLEPSKPQADVSEATSHTVSPDAQNTEENQPHPEPTFQTTTEEAIVTNSAPQTNQDPPIDIPEDTKIATAPEETLIAANVSPLFSKFTFNTKTTPYPTNEQRSSEKYRYIEDLISPKSTTLSFSHKHVKDHSAHDSAVPITNEEAWRIRKAQREERRMLWAKRDAERDERFNKFVAALAKLNEDFDKWLARFEALSAKLEKFETFYDL